MWISALTLLPLSMLNVFLGYVIFVRFQLPVPISVAWLVAICLELYKVLMAYKRQWVVYVMLTTISVFLGSGSLYGILTPPKDKVELMSLRDESHRNYLNQLKRVELAREQLDKVQKQLDLAQINYNSAVSSGVLNNEGSTYRTIRNSVSQSKATLEEREKDLEEAKKEYEKLQEELSNSGEPLFNSVTSKLVSWGGMLLIELIELSIIFPRFNDIIIGLIFKRKSTQKVVEEKKINNNLW